MGYAKKRLPPRASGSTWRKPSHRPEGNAVRRATQIEGSIMDAKTGANIKTGKFVVGDRDTTFPIYEGTIGPSVIDIGKFYAETGMFTYDPGYTSTGSCESKITYIDGDEGILLYRGYPIE
jgi:Citrate synthase, C-terminal domain